MISRDEAIARGTLGGTSVNNDLRLELRTRNNLLWHLIYDAHASVEAFCRGHDLNSSDVGLLLNLKRGPYRKTKVWVCAQRLCDIAHMAVEDLFPEDLYSGVFGQRLVAEIPSSAFRGLAAAKRLALPPAQDALVERRELREALEEAMRKTLSSRAQRILRARFGFDEHENEATLRDLSNDLWITPGRIQQIAQNSLEKLSRTPHLRKLCRELLRTEPGNPYSRLKVEEVP